MICWATFSLLLIVVPPFSFISEERITVKQGDDVELLCVNSRSHDEVVWVPSETCKDDNVYIDKNLTPCTRRFHTFHKGISGSTAEMVLKNAHPLDSGHFVCEHWLLDSEYRKVFIKVLDDRDALNLSISTLSTVLVIFIIASCTIFVGLSLLRHKKKLNKLMESRKQLMEQLHPYNSPNKWEMSSKDLIIIKQLGTGSFSRVFKAQIVGPGCSTVALKTGKTKTNTENLVLLVRQLKTLAKLGVHLNVVNLLGAVTKNMIKGEMVLVLEYCRNGSLQHLIRANKTRFVNQLDGKGDLKDFNLSRSNMIECQRQLTPLSKHRMNAVERLNSFQRRLINSCRNLTTSRQVSSFTELEESTIITTRDLIDWSYQIACGMNYIAKNGLIHGELTARNVLLADDNVVKITDIGLSNEAFESKSSRFWNWMAIETLQNKVFSSQSDVWSFGVTMWELFSLGQEPFSGIRDKAALIEILKDEKRLERPAHAPNAIADLMGNCWNSDPKQRLTFSKLQLDLGKLSGKLTSRASEKNKVALPSSQEHNQTTQDDETCIEIPRF